MAEYSFLTDKSGKWSIFAPRRARRPMVGEGMPVCPFCPGGEQYQKEAYRVGGEIGDKKWKLLVIANKYPFTNHHEVLIHSPHHAHNFDALPISQVLLILETYKQRMQLYKNIGNVYIFHNHGRQAGESITHPHSQITVIPEEFTESIPLASSVLVESSGKRHSLFTIPLPKKLSGRFQVAVSSNTSQHNPLQVDPLMTDYFQIVCPAFSEWPDEVWIVPRRGEKMFCDSTSEELIDLAFGLSRVIQLLDMRYGHEFPFNFYIYPRNNWYLRIIPRIKMLGGFEIGTRVMVNTQDPGITQAFINEHFWRPDSQKIMKKEQADYKKRV